MQTSPHKSILWSWDKLKIHFLTWYQSHFKYILAIVCWAYQVTPYRALTRPPTIYSRVFDHDEVIFFSFYQNGVCLKKITNLGKSCQFGTTSYVQIVPIWHDFTMSYWSRANLARLLSCHTEVVTTWHDFCNVIILIFFKFYCLYIG